MKKLLLPLFCALSFLSFGQVNLSQNLVAHYPFDGNANDLSGYALHGTAFGETYATGVYGAPNSSIQFDGTSGSYVDCGTDNRGITDTLSISVFVRTTFDGIGDLVSKYDPGSDEGYHFQISLGKIRLAGRDGSGTYRQTGFSSTVINDSLWHHVLGVVRGDTWILYVDCNLEGAESNPGPTPDISSNAELGIGKDVFGDAKFLDCEVDEVRMYTRLLTEDERDSLCATAVYAGIESPETQAPHIQVYPNPAQDKIAIAAESTLEKATVEIWDLNGKLLLTERNLSSTPIIDISDLESGNYIVKIIQDQQVFTEKFVKI
ncbi:MAG: LamG-like jellyroll fold domain-containing protein [Crocinitomicaceae bacterium]